MTEQVCRLLDRVGLRPDHSSRYPHDFPEGNASESAFARALALNPKLIVCDEAVSALDVSIQAQIINLLKDLQADYDLSYLFITHDLNVVQYLADRIAVMYLGKLAEVAPADTLFSDAKHPYTQALLSANPLPDPTVKRERILLSGDVPTPLIRRRLPVPHPMPAGDGPLQNHRSPAHPNRETGSQSQSLVPFVLRNATMMFHVHVMHVLF